MFRENDVNTAAAAPIEPDDGVKVGKVVLFEVVEAAIEGASDEPGTEGVGEGRECCEAEGAEESSLVLLLLLLSLSDGGGAY